MVKKLKDSKKVKNKLTNKQSQKQVVNIHIGNKGKKSGGYKRSQPRSETKQLSHYQTGFTPVYIQSGSFNDVSPLVHAVGELGNTIRNQSFISQPSTQPVSVNQPISGIPVDNKSMSIQTNPTKEDKIIKELIDFNSRVKDKITPKYDKSKNSEFLSKLKNDKFEVENPLLNPPEKKDTNTPTSLFTGPEKIDASTSTNTPLFSHNEKVEKSNSSSYMKYMNKVLNNGESIDQISNRIRVSELERRRQNLRDEFLVLGGSVEELQRIKNNQTEMKSAISKLKKNKKNK